MYSHELMLSVLLLNYGFEVKNYLYEAFPKCDKIMDKRTNTNFYIPYSNTPLSNFKKII